MDRKNEPKPASTTASATKPEDLNVPEHEPPSMPEAADKPERPLPEEPNNQAKVDTSGPAASNRAPRAPSSETEPEDLNVPEHEPPSMPEAADKPERPLPDTQTKS